MTSEERPETVPREIRELIESWPRIPAFVRDRYLTVLVANDLARAVSTAFRDGVNLARSTFLESDVLRSNPDPDVIAEHVAGNLRQSLNQHEADDGFERIVGELEARSTAFAGAWARDDTPGSADAFTFTPDVVGPMTLAYQQLSIPGSYDLTLVVWRPTDDRSRMALARLAEIASGAAEA
ncbi:MmyB family transcriptional regulator [Leifsonia sp. 22587]|uniref:MmyB family transcriptional regulator n=1 Tax=Leifsonia sp. 22587 TaxID=3453946 RepID=UPI003F861A18